MTLFACAESRTQPAFAQAKQQAAQKQPVKNAKSSPESGEATSCHAFVQSFYDWYIGRLNRALRNGKFVSTVDEARLRKPAVLSLSLSRLLLQDEQASARNSEEIVGLDFDPIINAQDWSGNYIVKSTNMIGARCRARVWAYDGAQNELVEPELELANGRWIFVNFHYPEPDTPSDENLISMLLALRNDREHSKSEKSK